MNDIQQSIDFQWRGTDGDFQMANTITQDNVPTLTRNRFERLNSNGNWSDKRTMRKIASVPMLALFKAEEQGVNTNDRGELMAWLDKHPEFWTVERLRADSCPKNFIIK